MLPVGRCGVWAPGRRRSWPRWGIKDVRTLADTDVRHLEKILGRASGRHLHELSHGVDPRRVEPVREEKSVGTETTFFETLTDREHARRVLLDQTHQCAARLRAADLRCRVAVLKARGADFTTVTRSRTLAAPTDLAQDIWETVASLYSALPSPPGGFRLLGVRVEGAAAPRRRCAAPPGRGPSAWRLRAGCRRRTPQMGCPRAGPRPAFCQETGPHGCRSTR